MMTQALTPNLPLALASLFAALTCCAHLTACETRAEQVGQREQLRFSYQAADRSRDFSRPIAEGASLFVRVEGLKQERVTQILSHDTSNASVFSSEKSAVRADEVILTAAGSGRATLSVASELEGGERREDRIELETARPDRASLAHPCTAARDAAYLEGEPIELGFERYADGAKLVGRGACGLALAPRHAAIERIACDERHATLYGLPQPGTLRVKTGLHAPYLTQRSALNVQVVTIQKLDFAPLEEHLSEWSSASITLRPQTDLWPICTALSFEIEILTPDTCELEDTPEELFGRFGPRHRNTLQMRTFQSGSCKLRVGLPAYGVSDLWELSLPVYSSDDSW